MTVIHLEPPEPQLPPPLSLSSRHCLDSRHDRWETDSQSLLNQDEVGVGSKIREMVDRS